MANMRWPFLVLLTWLLVECEARRLQEEGSVSSSIVRGFPALRGRYPWMVSLRYNDGVGSDHRCGGSLIHPRVVMTAAHCVVDTETGLLLPPDTSLPIVRVGGYSRTLDAPSAYDLRETVRTVWHPRFVTGYRPNHMSYDVALLVLDRPATKPTVRLPPYTPKPDLPLPSGTKLTALGWGWTVPSVEPNTNFFSEQLQEVRLKLLPLSECEARYGLITYTDSREQPRTVPFDWLAAPTMCSSDVAYPAPKAGTCAGDSGGPHFVKGRNPSEDMQYGIESFGPRPCGGFMGGVTDVAALRPWIDQAVSLLTASSWSGSVLGGQRVFGFYGTRTTGTLAAGSNMTVLATGGQNATSLTAKLDKGLSGMQAVITSLEFRTAAGGLRVELRFWGNNLGVVVNGARLLPGRKRVVPAGSVQFANLKAGQPRQVTIEQPGMTVRAEQPLLSAGGKGLARWLDVRVRLTSAPLAPRGVLGATFPRI